MGLRLLAVQLSLEAGGDLPQQMLASKYSLILTRLQPGENVSIRCVTRSRRGLSLAACRRRLFRLQIQATIVTGRKSDIAVQHCLGLFHKTTDVARARSTQRRSCVAYLRARSAPDLRRSARSLIATAARGHRSDSHAIARGSLYEHQNPVDSVAWLIGLHLPGPGLPVVPHARQIQKPPC